jgi:hypothetical protein
MIGRVPVFCGKNQIESRLQFIRKRDDLITVQHWQRAARQKVILKIDNDERVHVWKLSRNRGDCWGVCARRQFERPAFHRNALQFLRAGNNVDLN